MRQFLYKIIYLLPVLLLIIFAELQYRSMPNAYSYKSQYIEKKGEEMEILVLGSSHSYYGVNPEYFDQKCFNLGFYAQSIDYDYYLLNKYIDKLSELKYMILPVSYTTFTSKLKETSQAYRKYYYSYYMNYKKRINLKDVVSWKYYLMISHTRGINALERFLHHLFNNKKHINCDINGWGKPSSETHENLKAEAKIKAKKHEDNSYDMNENREYLNGIIQICNNQNIQLLLFTPPFTSYYVNSLNSRKWEMITEKCDSLEKQYSNVRYINFLHDTTFNDSLFLNSDHLNADGSKVLSEKMNKVITSF